VPTRLPTKTFESRHANVNGILVVYQNSPENFQPFSKISVKDIRNAWCQFLGRWEWEWFLTLTFRDIVHPEAADKAFRYFVSRLNRQLYGPRWFRKAHGGIPWVRALEHQRRGVIHFHGLFADVKNLRRLTCMDMWDDIAGYARIEPIKDKWAVRHYVTKYCLKEGEIELGGALSKPARALLNQIPSSIPAHPTFPFKTNSDAGGEYATSTQCVSTTL